MAMILEVESVSQTFRTGFWMRRVQILHEVSLKVPERSIFGFLGANGAGKTTLIQLIVGLRKPTGGQLKVAGYLATTPHARARLGYLPERPYFYDHLTGEDFLKFFGVLSGMKKPEIRARIPQVLRAVGLEAARKVELRKFSKGMLQRVGIAQAILHDPEFLVLDEPMSGLDPLGRKDMRELITNLAAEGRTIFFSSHVIPDVEAICDQVALIQKGRLIASGPVSGFLSGGSVRTEIGVTGVTEDVLRKLPGVSDLRQIPDGLRAVIDGEEAPTDVLRSLLGSQKGAKILWVNPIRPSLESFFEKG